MSDLSPATTLDELSEIAKKLGCVVILPVEDELTLDLDGGMFVRQNVIDSLHRNSIRFLSTFTTISKSGNKHLWIKLDRTMTISERIAIQGCLGSDPVRESISLLRFINGHAISLAVFETPDQAKAVMMWRERCNTPSEEPEYASSM